MLSYGPFTKYRPALVLQWPGNNVPWSSLDHCLHLTHLQWSPHSCPTCRQWSGNSWPRPPPIVARLDNKMTIWCCFQYFSSLPLAVDITSSGSKLYLTLQLSTNGSILDLMEVAVNRIFGIDYTWPHSRVKKIYFWCTTRDRDTWPLSQFKKIYFQFTAPHVTVTREIWQSLHVKTGTEFKFLK